MHGPCENQWLRASHTLRVYFPLAQNVTRAACNGGTGDSSFEVGVRPTLSHMRAGLWCKHTTASQSQVRCADLLRIIRIVRILPGVVHRPRHFMLRMDMLAYRANFGAEQGKGKPNLRAAATWPKAWGGDPSGL